MHPIDCPHEDDVVDLVNTGQWPDRADDDLKAHVASCMVCRDLVTVACAFADAESMPAPALPDASMVWLRSQIRAREAATRLAERPISVAQAVAFASAIGALGAVFGASSSWLQGGIKWVGAALASIDPQAIALSSDATALLTQHAVAATMIGVAILIMPIAVYWGLKDN
jgi:hypothetical protein